jgi:hypothetical protein
VVIFGFGDRVAQALTQYSTAMPLKFVFGVLGIGFLVGTFVFLGAIVLLFAMAWFFLRQAFAGTELPGWRGMSKSYYRDALLIGTGGTAGLAALRRISEWLSARWPTPHQSLGAAFGSDFASVLPGIAISATAVLHGLLFTGAIAVAAGFIAAHCKSPVIRALLFVLASLGMVSGWGNTADFLKQWIMSAAFLAVVVFGVAKILRMNLLGYFLVLAIPTLLAGCVEMVSQPNSFYHSQGVVCVAALALFLVWAVWAWLTAKQDLPADVG